VPQPWLLAGRQRDCQENFLVDHTSSFQQDPSDQVSDRNFGNVDVAETFSSDRKEGILGVLIVCLDPAATACDPAPTTVATVSDLRNIGFLLRFGT